jgi:hypothetical protein
MEFNERTVRFQTTLSMAYRPADVKTPLRFDASVTHPKLPIARDIRNAQSGIPSLKFTRLVQLEVCVVNQKRKRSVQLEWARAAPVKALHAHGNDRQSKCLSEPSDHMCRPPAR